MTRNQIRLISRRYLEERKDVFDENGNLKESFGVKQHYFEFSQDISGKEFDMYILGTGLPIHDILDAKNGEPYSHIYYETPSIWIYEWVTPEIKIDNLDH